MNYQAGQFRTLEARFERLLLDLASIQAQVANLQTQVAGLQQGGSGQGQQGGGTGVYEIPGGVAIGANSYVTGQTVYALTGGNGTSTAVSANAVVFNVYGVATTAGKALTLGQNPDGTFTVLGQSC
jgi:hypothetical protein